MKNEWLQWLKYYAYRYFSLLLLIPVIAILNYADAKLIDIFLLLFSNIGMPELASLVVTLIIVLLISLAIIIVLLKLGKKKIRPRLFPIAPEKPVKEASAAVKKIDCRTNLQMPVCNCAPGASRDMLNMIKLTLSSGETAVMTANIIKKGDGSGWIRSDCQVGKQVQAGAFRINFCPMCGGKFITSEPNVSDTSSGETDLS